MKSIVLLFTIIFSFLSLKTNPSSEIIERNNKCLEIFNKLKKVKGLNPNDAPQLEIVEVLPNDQFSLAMASPKTGIISLENRTRDLCFDDMPNMTEDALAYLLSHELSHITRQHNVRHRFIERFQKSVVEEEEFRSRAKALSDSAKTEVEKFLLKTDTLAIKYRIRKNEAEADLDAGFTAFLAGYNTKDAGPAFLQKSYDKFNLKIGSSHYASLDERKQILKITGQKLDSLKIIYEMGSYLSLVNEYDAAYDCYNKVGETYKSSALLNNLGVLNLMEVCESIPIRQLKYALPLVLDFNLNPGRDVDEDERRELFNNKLYILDDAISHFEQAIDLNPNYYNGYINQSIAYFLKYIVKNGEKEFASYIGDDLIFSQASALRSIHILESKNYEEKTKGLVKAQLMLALIADVKGDKDESKNLIQKTMQMDSSNLYVKANKNLIFENQEVKSFLIRKQDKSTSKCREKETILKENLSVEDVIFDVVKQNWNIKQVIKNVKGEYLNTKTQLQYYKADNFVLYNLIKLRGIKKLREDYSFITVLDNYGGATACAIDRKNTKQDVMNAYGDPTYVMNTSSATSFQYADSSKKEEGFVNGILFHIGQSDSVKYWTIFETAK